MIFYRPTDGDPHPAPFNYRPQTCFIMTQLGGSVPPEVGEIRRKLTAIFDTKKITCIDASTEVTGRDFLLKIWELIVSVPVGIAILHQGMTAKTIGNIFYELGLMQAYGKETLIVKSPEAEIPSDFVRTEYVNSGPQLEKGLEKFCRALDQRADYYRLMADQVENNPLLAIDFLRRAYLLTGDKSLRDGARLLFDSAGLSSRAKNSVEALLISSFGKRS